MTLCDKNELYEKTRATLPSAEVPSPQNLIAIDRRGAAPLEPMHRSTKVQCLGAAGFFIALYALNVCRRRVCRAEQRGRP